MTGTDKEAALRDAVAIAKATGYEVIARHGDMSMYRHHRYLGSLVVYDEHILAEGDKHDIRVPLALASWREKLRDSLKRRGARLDAEEERRVEEERRAKRFEERKRAGLAVLGPLPHDVEAEYTEKGDRYPWSFVWDEGMPLEDAASVAFALRLAAPYRPRRIWRGGVAEQVNALRASVRFKPVYLTGEDTLRALHRCAATGQEPTQEVIDARLRDDARIAALALAAVGAKGGPS